MYRLIAVLFLSTLAFSQATKPSPKPAAPAAKSPSAQAAPAAQPSQVPESAPVITIEGLCNGKVPATPTPGCKTEITRAAFEKLVNALDPQMPAVNRQRLGEAYARFLAMSDVATQRGIANTPEAEVILQFARMQTLTQLLVRDLQKKAADVPPAEIEKFYNAHPQQFEQATLQRIFLPKTPPGGEKPPDEKTLQAEADKIHAAAVAGGDFDKLQKQAYDDLGIKTPPPPTSAGTQRRDAMPPAQSAVFDLQPGQISQVINEPGGLYIFKMQSKKKESVADATPEIKRAMESDRLRDSLESLTDKLKPVFNTEYFGGGAAPPRLPPNHPPIPPQHPGSSAPPAKPPGK